MNVDELVFPERVFQVWLYTVGMARLLLRSTKSPTFPTRVDILFQNVMEMSIPTSLDGLTISEPTAEERRTIQSGWAR